MEQLIGVLAMFVRFIIIIVLGIYIAISNFLNNFNKLVYGKGTAMAWIPIFNVYLLAKLTTNKIVGWILLICAFLSSTITITLNGVKTTYTILPESISSVVLIFYNLAVLGLFIYAIIKYNQLKKNSVNNNQQPQQYQQSIQLQYNQSQQPLQSQYTQSQYTQQQYINNNICNNNICNHNNLVITKFKGRLHKMLVIQMGKIK